MEKTKVMRIPVPLVPQVMQLKLEFERKERIAIAEARQKVAKSA